MAGYVYVCPKCGRLVPSVGYGPGEMVPRGTCGKCGDVIVVIGMEGEKREDERDKAQDRMDPRAD